MPLQLPANAVRQIFSNFNDFCEQKQFCDVVIKVGGRSFHCHRVILAAASIYFQKMFSGQFNEIKENEIELKNLEADDFELFLTYIYGNSISFGQDDSYRLLRISHYFGVPELEKRCIQYMYDNADTDNITLETAFNILNLSSTSLKNERLEEKFIAYVAKSYVAALECPNFIHISGAHLLKILRHPMRTGNSIAMTLDFLEKWLQSQPSKLNVELLPDLLKATHVFQSPDELFLRAIRLLNYSISPIKCEPIKCENESNYTYETEMLSGNIVHEIDQEQICDHEKIKIPFVVYSLDYYQKSNIYLNLYKFWDSDKVQLWKPISESKIFKDKRMKSKFCKSILVDGIHHVLISEMHPDSCRRQSATYYYKPHISQGFKLSQVKDWPAYDHSVEHAPGGFDFPTTTTTAALGTNIYVYDQFCFVVLNCQTGQWTKMLEDDLVRTKHANLVSHDSNLYLIGGLSSPLTFGGTTKKTHKERFVEFAELNGRRFQRFDVREGKWMKMPTLTYARNQSASCVHNGVLFVSGGDDFMYHKRAVECYDFKAGKWRTLESSMPAPKLNHISLAYDNQLWFFGGRKYENGSSDLRPDKSWYSYNLVEHTWSKIHSISSFDNDFQMVRILDVVSI